MQVFNVRMGLATNSSSTHSLILIPGQRYGDTSDPGSYGWDDFTIGSRDGKLHYVGVILRDALKSSGLPQSYIDFTIKGLIGDAEVHEDDYIDHQSAYFLPHEFGSQMPDVRFIQEFRDFMLRDDLVILGGNDNSDGHPLAGGGFNLPIQREGAPPMVCRKDPTYGFWTLFDPTRGTKIRFSFNDLDKPPEKASTPELVDLKVTDYCPYDCPFCYQDSTQKGNHADANEILYRIIPALGKMKVFEIAIGGGEPTLMPAFTSILKVCRREGIVPNFTTKSLKWLRNQKQRHEILESAGAFAYSVIDPKELDDLIELVDQGSLDKNQVSIQLVMGIHSMETFEVILKKADGAGIRTTLLGYKTNGRGKDCAPMPYDWWIDAVKNALGNEYRWSSPICIDTALAAEYEDQLKAEGVPEWLYHTKEGSFSMYIDAVERRIAPSSYCDSSEIWELLKDVVAPRASAHDYDWDESIRTAFARF